jgi:hypothetical protein
VSSWLDDLESRAPDVVACWRRWREQGTQALRDELRSRVTPGSTRRILPQLEATADALANVLATLPDEALEQPGGEEDWNVAQAFGHTTAGRRWLAAWAALAARGEWPDDPDRAPRARPSVPGAEVDRQTLESFLSKSQRVVAEAGADIEGRETEPSPFDNPFLEGRLRCGEWLLYTGVHDVMHLEQLHRLAGDA